MVKLKSNSKQTHIKLSTRLMETSAENRKENNMKKLNRKKKISLDCYLDFLLSRNDLNLTVDFIHQVLSFRRSFFPLSFLSRLILLSLILVRKISECFHHLQIINMHGFRHIRTVRKVLTIYSRYSYCFLLSMRKFPI